MIFDDDAQVYKDFLLFKNSLKVHCVKRVRMWSYSVPENAGQNNSEYGLFSRSICQNPDLFTIFMKCALYNFH